MATVLNLERLRTASFHAVPGRWALIEDSYTTPHAGELLSARYPSSDFEIPLQRRIAEAVGRHPGRFRTSSRPLLRSLDPAMAGYLAEDARTPNADAGRSMLMLPVTLDEVWRRLAEDLLSSEYRAVMSELSGLDLSNAPLQADFEVGEQGSWYHAHRDRGRRKVSHIFYFNDAWQPRWGGCLRMLEARDIERVIDEVVPLTGTSVVMLHDGGLWHGTLPLTEPAVERRSLHVWFWV